MRIILDQLFRDWWYTHVDRRLTVYKKPNNEQLSRCMAMADQIHGGDTENLDAWNHESLRWRENLK